MPTDNDTKRPPNATGNMAHEYVGQLSLPCREIRAACICTTRLMECTWVCLKLKATWQLATIVKPLAAPRLSVLVWRRDGLVQVSKTDMLYFIGTSEALCLQWCVVCARQAVSLTLSTRNAAWSRHTAPRVNARQVGMPVRDDLPAKSSK